MISWGQSMQYFVKSYQFVLIPANLKRFLTKFRKKSLSTLQSFVPPETILAASIWAASRSFFDAKEQLSHTVSIYSKCGQTYA